MNKVFTKNGWEDYLFWESEDRKTLKRINQLIEDICRHGNEGIGKPEALKGDLSGFWSRRINDKDRLVYIPLILKMSIFFRAGTIIPENKTFTFLFHKPACLYLDEING